MKTEWKCNFGPLTLLWLVGGGAAAYAVAAATNGCGTHGCGMNGPMSTASTVALCVWLGPFALALALGAILFVGWALQEAVPKRVRVPVTEDLREHATIDQKETRDADSY